MICPSYGPEESSAVVELTYNYGVREYARGDAYKRLALASADVPADLQANLFF